MKKLLVAALVLAAAVGAALFVGSNEPVPAERPDNAVSAPAVPLQTHNDEPTVAAGSVGAIDPADAQPDESEPPKCERLRIDQAHPWFVAEMTRIEPLTPSGPGMAVYRSLGEDDLLSLAAQKDSGAMVVLGARAELRAEGKSEDLAVDRLDGQRSVVQSWTRKPLDEDVHAALTEAERWYYQAALHGRIFAMFKIGILRERLNGGAVEFGWVDEDAYAAMDTKRRADFYPPVIFGAAATALAPEITQSPLMTLALESAGLDKPAGDPATVELVVSEFRADLRRNGLSLPSIPPYEGPDIDAWRAEFCSN